MKTKDIYLLLFLLFIFIPFIISDTLYNYYDRFYSLYPFTGSFIKFAILATTGEVIGLRIKTGRYFAPGFGILPRALVWGILGITIQAAFIIFSAGVPVMLEFAGLSGSIDSMTGPFTLTRLGVAFSISFLLNIFYAPVLMTAHKVTDSHIEMNNGTVRGLFSRINVSSILKNIDWDTHWGFVLKKTIFFFWIPAQTVNFLMPEQFRVLIAAIYGIILGVILAVASVSKADF